MNTHFNDFIFFSSMCRELYSLLVSKTNLFFFFWEKLQHGWSYRCVTISWTHAVGLPSSINLEIVHQVAEVEIRLENIISCWLLIHAFHCSTWAWGCTDITYLQWSCVYTDIHDWWLHSSSILYSSRSVWLSCGLAVL